MAVYDTLIANRKKYPTPMSNSQLGQLLNETSYAHRGEGYGMLAKSTGANCQQPTTGVYCSRDIICIIVGVNLVLYDCLIDAEGKATPTWDKKSNPLQDLSRFVDPVDPLTATAPPSTTQPAQDQIPYDENYSIRFGLGCNEVYKEANTAAVDPGMISVHSQRCGWDYYVGGLTQDESYYKHIDEFRAVYGLPPVSK